LMTDLLSDPSADPAPDEYEGIDPALAQRLRDKDNHIKTIESENAQFRTELRARTSLEEITERIARQAQQAPTPDPNGVAAPPAQPEPDIAQQVLKILEAEKAKANREANIEKTRSGLREKFGADYNAYLLKAAKLLNVSEKFLADLGASSPDGLLKLVDSLPLKEGDGDIGTPPPSNVNTAGAFNQTVRKNKAYFDNIRKSDRAKYFSAAVQKEMHDEAVRQGSKFFE
jgi:hypothetical protein